MLHRRQFIGSIAAGSLISATAARLSAANDDLNLSWPCDVIQTEPRRYANNPPVVTGVSIQPNGDRIAVVGDDHFVNIYDIRQRKFTTRLGQHTDWVRTARFSPDGKWLATAGNDRQIRIWNSSQLASEPRTRNFNSAVIQIAFSPDSRFLAAVGFNYELQIFDLEKDRVAQRLRCECPDNHAVSFSDDGLKIAAGGRSGKIRVWDSGTGRQLHQFSTHKQRIRGLIFVGNDELVSCGDDQLVRLTRLSDANNPRALPRRNSKLFSIARLNQNLIASAGSDNLIHIWRIDQLEEVGILKGHTGTVSCLDFDGSKLVSGSFDTQIRIWSIENELDPVARQTNLPDAWNQKR